MESGYTKMGEAISGKIEEKLGAGSLREADEIDL